MNRSGLSYILENQVPIAIEDILQWGRWMEDPNNKRVALTKINELRVSTVFLGVNNQFNEGQPFLFETVLST